MADDDGIGDALGDRVVRSLRAWVGRAARSGRAQLELRQHHKDLDLFWVRLGKTAFRLLQAGEVDHPALRKAVERIVELEAKIDALTAERSGAEDDGR